MSLLQLEHVSKRFRHGARYVEVLRDVSLELHQCELVSVWGLRHAGRSTLLRIAAGLEAPDSGVVRLRGRALSIGRGPLAGAIAYCQPALHTTTESRLVLDELIAAQLALGIRPSGARARALLALERAHARHCDVRRPCELDRAEAARVGIARALLQGPSVLVIDEPTTGVDPFERDRILELLRSLSRDGTAVLMSVDKGTSLFASDRALSLSYGELRGHVAPELAPVLPLRSSA